MWIRDRLDGPWNDEDFTAWYPRHGRPGLPPPSSPRSACCKYVLNLSDRQAAEVVRCRLDFKYALGLEREDPGFHHSVLSGFRDRLAEGDRADRLLGLALTRWSAWWRDPVSGCSYWSWAAVCGVDRLAGRFCR
ncbi:transposase [Streptomyces sp. MK7]|uniref:transposase n=1 Tax=Streptomyces sp. MK7 TaxID=3067635 RepID=UPI0029305FFA|nr:transposase [Streptomyces sp. MK7]